MGIELTIGDGYQPPKPVLERRVSTRNLMEESWQIRFEVGVHEDFIQPPPRSGFLGFRVNEEIFGWLCEHDPLHYEWSIHNGTAVEFSSDATAFAFKMRWL